MDNKKEGPIIDGKVSLKKKKPSLLSVLLYDNTDVIARRGIKEIIIPKTKQMLLSLVALALNGDSSYNSYPGYRYNTTSGIPYVDAYGRQKQRNTTSNKSIDRATITLYNRGDAEKIVQMVHEYYDRYNVVSMGTLYRWVGQDPPHTYDRYGWATDSSINRFNYKTSIDPDGNEIYVLDFPTPSIL